MRRPVLPAIAIVLVAVLAMVVVRVGFDAASGSPTDGDFPVSPRVAAPAVPPAVTVPCAVVPSRRTSQVIRLSGACRGEVDATAACSGADEGVTASVAADLADGRSFVLSVIVAEPSEDGRRSAIVLAQVGEDGLRWTDRQVPVRVGTDGSVVLRGATLQPEPGTPTVGVVRVAGTLACG